MNFIADIEQRLKSLLGHGPLKQSTSDPANYSGALADFVATRTNRIDPDRLAPRKDGAVYHEAIAKMEPYFNFFNNDVKEANPTVKEIFEYDNFHSGTPLRHKPFPSSIRNLKKTLRQKNLYWYPRTPGGYRSQQKFLDYLAREGFDLDAKPGYDGIGVDNIVFTCSTTHAYSLILNTIANENDVILMPAPNYGLFAIMTELDNFHLATIDLRAEDDWFVNPKRLAKRIDEINHQLAKDFAGQEHIPRVAAFVNFNPHNPIGNVMNRKNHQVLESIAEVCLQKNVFVIDDLVYRDLTYDLDDLALPMASYPQYFSNVISLFGLSKAYNLASVRAAVILAPLPVAEMITNELHNTMDSVPVLQVAATVGAFNGTNRRYREWRHYLTPIIREYQYRYHLLYALVYGINQIKNPKIKSRIKRDIRRYAHKDAKILFAGCKNLSIKFKPASGFFAVFDFTKLKGKVTPEGVVIKTECDLLNFFFAHGGVKYLMGGNIFWPNPNEFVARISFALDKKAIIHNMLIINRAIQELK